MIKKCFKCNVVKGLECFYKHPKMKDGHVNKCKECNKKDVRQNREKKAEYYRKYSNERYANEEHVRRRITEFAKKWRQENPEKYKAHTIVNNAKRSGKLALKPCEVCGSWENLHAHHDDYSKPLEVRWLCAEHHRKHHV